MKACVQLVTIIGGVDNGRIYIYIYIYMLNVCFCLLADY